MNKMRPVSAPGADLIEQFLEWLDHRELSPRTRSEYAADLRHFIGWFEYQGMDNGEAVRIFSFEQIALNELGAYLMAMKKRDLKPSTINRRLSSIKLFFDWAYRHSFAAVDLGRQLKLPPLAKASPRIMTRTEENRLFEAVRASGNPRDQALIELLVHTGLRAWEISSLQPADVQLGPRSGWIRVGREPQRTVPLNPAGRAVLGRYLEMVPADRRYLFVSEKTSDRLTDRALRHILKKYMDSAGLSGFSVYSLRHSFGYKKGARTPMHTLAQLMGHGSLKTTRSYLKPRS